MICIKLAILLGVILIISRIFIIIYVKGNPKEAIKIVAGVNRWYTVTWGLLFIIEMILILISVIWLLFLK